MNRILRAVSVEVLVFPVLVVLLTSLGFLCGLHISAWNWWCALLLCLVTPFFILDKKTAVWSVLVFVAILFGLKVVCFLNIDPTWVDNDAYHLPATRMLIEGWNPFYDATPERIGLSMSLDPLDMRVWHVLCVHKAVYYFNAAAYFFHGDPLAITYPIGYFLFLSLVLICWSEFDGFLILRLGLLYYLFVNCLHTWNIVDSSVGMAGLALLITLQKTFNDGRFRWLPLLCFSFWMITAKASGTLACFAMWVVFAIAWLCRSKGVVKASFVKLTIAGSVLAFSFCIACSSPYVTAFSEYGHPLYPAVTANTDKYPVYTITDDLVNGNADRQVMGGIGSFVNAYVSPTLAQHYYSWKLKRQDFKPMTRAWFAAAAEQGEPTACCPTTFNSRVMLWAALLALSLVPGYRLMPGCVLVALIFVPNAYYGYWRYFPWVEGVRVLAAFAVINFIFGKAMPARLRGILESRRVMYILLAMELCCLPKQLIKTAVGLDEKMACQKLNDKIVYSNVYGTMAGTQRVIPDELKAKVPTGCGEGHRVAINSIKLLARKVECLKNIEIKGVAQSELKDKYKNPMGFYADHETPLLLEKYHQEKSRVRRVLNYPKYVCESFARAMK